MRTEDRNAGGLYGLLVRFDTPEALVAAARRAREAGYRRLDAYSPFPVRGLSRALGLRKPGVSVLVLLGGITGGSLGYFLQYWISAVAYPLNVGGRPYHSWPSFIPVAFEMTVLFAALSAVIGLLALNGLPRPHHPIFGAPGFDRASTDAFFLCIESADPMFDPNGTRDFLAALNPVAVAAVPEDRG